MAEEKTIEINMSEDVQPETSFESKQNEFVNREFMKAFRILQHVTTSPTHTPKNFFEQIVILNNGATYELYIYVNGSWKKTVLS